MQNIYEDTINKSLERIFDRKYNGQKSFRYLYNGYFHDIDDKTVETQSEYLCYVLSDGDMQSFFIAHNFGDVVKFLRLTNEQVKELYQEIKTINEFEDSYVKLLKMNNQTVEKYYWRKLFILETDINKELKN